MYVSLCCDRELLHSTISANKHVNIEILFAGLYAIATDISTANACAFWDYEYLLLLLGINHIFRHVIVLHTKQENRNRFMYILINGLNPEIYMHIIIYMCRTTHVTITPYTLLHTSSDIRTSAASRQICQRVYGCLWWGHTLICCSLAMGYGVRIFHLLPPVSGAGVVNSLQAHCKREIFLRMRMRLWRIYRPTVHHC